MIHAGGRAGRGLAIGISGLVVLLLTAGIVAVTTSFAGLTTPHRPAALSWLPSSPQWHLTTQAGAPVSVSSGVPVVGSQVAESLPASMQDAVSQTLRGRPGAAVWSAARATERRDGAHSAALQVLVGDDQALLEAVGDIGIGGPVRWSPARQIFAAQPATGTKWTGAGSVQAVGISIFSYRSTGAVTAIGPDGCATVAGTLDLEPTADGAKYKLTAVHFVDTETWCPARGTVKVTSPTTGLETTQVDVAAARTATTTFTAPVPLKTTPAAPATPGGPVELLARPLGSVVTADPVYVDDGGSGLVLDTDRGRQGVVAMSSNSTVAGWWLLSDSPVYATPATGAATVVVTDTAGTVTLLRAATGLVLWQARLDTIPVAAAIAAPSAATPGTVLVLGRDGDVTALALADGQIRFHTNGSASGSATAVGVAVSSSAGKPALAVVATAESLTALRLTGAEAGSVAWRYPGRLSAGPAVRADGSVLVGTGDGDVVAVRDGVKLWSGIVFPSRVDAVIAGNGGAGDTVAVLSKLQGQTAVVNASGSATWSAPGTVAGRWTGDALAIADVTQPDRARHAVVAVTDRDNEILLLDAAAKTVGSWQVPVTSLADAEPGAVGNALRTAAIVRDGTLWVAGNGGLVRWEIDG